jgi:tRNA/rRNA methyltransferase
MKNRSSAGGTILKDRFAVILNRPENPENIGLVARNMKNTGFDDLRLVGISSLENKAFVTAVHARDILEKARFYPNLGETVEELDVIFAATARTRKNFSCLTLNEALNTMFAFTGTTKIGLLFGKERTGLTSEELLHSNFRFMIPQAEDQPSYNLASAVLITLFNIFSRQRPDEEAVYDQPLSRKEQEACIRRILLNLEKKGFSHKTNEKHVEEMVFDLFGRLAMTARDRNLILALFSKGTQ